MAEGGRVQEGRRTALVTGASSGIGYELARVFAAEGFDLVLVARSGERLAGLAGELASAHGAAVRVIAKDLAVAAASREVWNELGEAGIRIDALVNNAGFGTYGPFSETDLNAELQEMQLNMVTPTELIKHFLPGMLARRWGRILNVASTAAFQPGPLMAVYYATKAYLLWFSEALSEELAGSGVTVTALCPGPTASGFQQRAQMEESKLFAGKKVMSSAGVARAGFDGLAAGRRIVIPGLGNKLLAQTVRISPRRLVTKIVQHMQKRTGGR